MTTPREVLEHHLTAFGAGDLDGLLATTAGAWQAILPVSTTVWMVVVSLFSFALVITRRYDIVEKVSTVLLWNFPGQVEALGGSGVSIIAVAFGWIGAGYAPTTYVWYACSVEILYSDTILGEISGTSIVRIDRREFYHQVTGETR